MADTGSQQPSHCKCGEPFREWYLAERKWRRKCRAPQAHVQTARVADFPTAPPLDYMPKRKSPTGPRGHKHKWSDWGLLGIFDKRIGRRCATCTAVQLYRGKFVMTPGMQGRGSYTR